MCVDTGTLTTGIIREDLSSEQREVRLLGEVDVIAMWAAALCQGGYDQKAV
jgi:hypothetical protein